MHRRTAGRTAGPSSPLVPLPDPLCGVKPWGATPRHGGRRRAGGGCTPLPFGSWRLEFRSAPSHQRFEGFKPADPRMPPPPTPISLLDPSPARRLLASSSRPAPAPWGAGVCAPGGLPPRPVRMCGSARKVWRINDSWNDDGYLTDVDIILIPTLYSNPSIPQPCHDVNTDSVSPSNRGGSAAGVRAGVASCSAVQRPGHRERKREMSVQERCRIWGVQGEALDGKG